MMSVPQNRDMPFPVKLLRIVALVLGIFIFQQFSSSLGQMVANRFTYRSVDPNGVFMWISVHHIVQAAVALIPIIFLSIYAKLDFGFRAGKKKIGFKFVGFATLGIIIYMIISYLIGYHFDLLSPYYYPLNLRNIMGSFAFQLILTGPSEEILFRALPITILAVFMKNDASKKVPIATIIAAALFSIAHINWYTGPFRIEYDVFQLGYAFAIGIVQGLALQKTGSIYYSMAIHSISNIISVGSGYLLFLLVL
ncbi:MAG: CPBP family intramembrane metalloprotease [Clostridiaceae bacterium]|nr:CPBP family intramembrane metalloprotease [Clostridiaceae bacterium]